MFVSLEHPGYDKHVSVFMRNLQGDEQFDPCSGYAAWDSDRYRADEAVEVLNKELAINGWKLFGTLFNQFRWRGTTGWEYWSKDMQLILKHALKVAERLGEPLHVHADILPSVLDAATESGMSVRHELAQVVAEIRRSDDMEFINGQIAAGKYVRLTVVG